MFVFLAQVDADFKLQETKRAFKELELKGKGFQRRLEELQNAIMKQMEQYAKIYNSLSCFFK